LLLRDDSQQKSIRDGLEVFLKALTDFDEERGENGRKETGLWDLRVIISLSDTIRGAYEN
jgi:hypothetical protein